MIAHVYNIITFIGLSLHPRVFPFAHNLYSFPNQRTGIMPTFHGQDTTIQLSVADLGRAITTTTGLRQSIPVSESIRNIALEFARGSKDGTLTETPLYAENESHVGFLGHNRTMLFFMVDAGKTFFDPNTNERRNRRAARIPWSSDRGGQSTSGTRKDGKTSCL